MKVIAGLAKGKKLIGVKSKNTRPTESRIKEALFSILQFKIENTCVLDLFSGSGQISIEALSRGAKFCTLVDHSIKSCSTAKTNLKLTNFLDKSKIIVSDCIKFLKKSQNKFNIIFLDPPYKSNLIVETITLAQKNLEKEGILICEHDSSVKIPSEFYNIKLQKQYSYGKISLTLYNLK